jgi:hypothetical protein
MHGQSWFVGWRHALAVIPCLAVVAPLPAAFIRGDSNRDGSVDISDAGFTLNFLFTGGRAPPCPAAADSNDDEVINISDPISTLRFLFNGDAPEPPPPWPDAGFDPTPGLDCGFAGGRAPALQVLAPAQGAAMATGSFQLRGRASDDRAVARIVVDGIDITPAGAPLAALTFSSEMQLPPGPSLIRVQAVDDQGRAVHREVAVCVEPFLAAGALGEGLALDLSASGFDEVEVLLRPFLAGVPALVDAAVRGSLLFEGSVLGADIRVTGNHVEMPGTAVLDLFPSADGGGRAGMSIRFDRVILFADGRSDYGFLGTDGWTATWDARTVTITTTFALAPVASGASLEVASDGFRVDIGSSELGVSGFLDPFGIFDGIVEFLAGLFQDEIEAEVKAAVERIAAEEIVPVLEDAFSGLRLDLDLGTLALSTLFHDAIESARGLSILFDAGWRGLERDPSYPPFPGSRAGFAPYPELPLPDAAAHPVDATISLSTDALDQALAALTAAGLIDTSIDLSGAGGPIELDVGTLASLIDPRLAELDGVLPSNPLGLRVRAEHPAAALLGEGSLARPILGEGAVWRYLEGFSEPPSGWSARVFEDSGWKRGPSGFGYSSDLAEVRWVRTPLPDMAAGRFTSFYARAAFEVTNPASARLLLRVRYDDSFVAYVNGTEVARENVTGSPPAHTVLSDQAIEPASVEVDLTPFRSILRAGTNVLAVQGHNAASSSSDFILIPEVLEPVPLPAGTLSAVPVAVEIEELTVAFQADTAEDGVGADDADGIPDEVDLFAFRLRLALRTGLLLTGGNGETAGLAFVMDTEDGPDPDEFPDAVIGGPAGLEIGVAREAVDIDDAELVGFAELVLGLFGPSLGDALGGFELPAFPLPELEFDLTGDGVPDVRLEIAGATFALADTGGERGPDWLCILSDLRAATR